MNIYPELVRGLTYTVMKTPEFDTLIQSAANKYDYRLPQSVNPFWSFQLTYNYLKDFPWDIVVGLITTDYHVLLDFFLAAQGQNASFLFLDPDDNYVGPALVNGSPNTPLAQLAVVNNGSAWYSPLQRTFGGLFYEDITDLNLNTATGGFPLEVYANGVLQVLGTDYTLSSSPGLSLPTASYMGLYIQWLSLGTPTEIFALNQVAGGSLPATTYYVRCTWVNKSGGEGLPNAENSLAVSADNLLVVSNMFPPLQTNVAGYNVYVGTSSGTETKQNSTPIPYSSTWTLPTSGLITGSALPTVDNSAQPPAPVTAQFGFYFRVRFATDAQDFEKFMNRLWNIGGDFSKNGSGVLKLCTSRPIPL